MNNNRHIASHYYNHKLAYFKNVLADLGWSESTSSNDLTLNITPDWDKSGNSDTELKLHFPNAFISENEEEFDTFLLTYGQDILDDCFYYDFDDILSILASNQAVFKSLTLPGYDVTKARIKTLTYILDNIQCDIFDDSRWSCEEHEECWEYDLCAELDADENVVGRQETIDALEDVIDRLERSIA